MRVDLVSRQQMTKRKLALVCQSCVILLSLAGWSGFISWFISKAVTLAVIVVLSWSGARSLVPLQFKVRMNKPTWQCLCREGKSGWCSTKPGAGSNYASCCLARMSQNASSPFS